MRRLRSQEMERSTGYPVASRSGHHVPFGQGCTALAQEWRFRLPAS